MKDNFLAFLRDERGRVMTRSIRRGHNVLTNHGRLWLSRILTWKTLGAADDEHTNLRVRWMMVGGGNLPETSAVTGLDSAIQVDLFGSYLKEVNNPPEFPLITGVRYKASYGTGDLSVSGSVEVSEAGLVIGESPANSGTSASIIESGGEVVVTGLSGMSPLSVGRILGVNNGDNPGPWRIVRFLSDSSVQIDSPHTGVDSGNPSISWYEGVEPAFANTPVVAYKTFEKIVKTTGFSLEIQWDFRF